MCVTLAAAALGDGWLAGALKLPPELLKLPADELAATAKAADAADLKEIEQLEQDLKHKGKKP